MRVEIFISTDRERLEENINEAIKGKELIDIKYSIGGYPKIKYDMGNREIRIEYSAMIIYNENSKLNEGLDNEL